MALKVFTTESIGAQRNHIAIYIETDPSEDRGWLHHVTGTILNGMDYTPRPTPNPEVLPEHVPDSKKEIGTIEEADLERFREECCLAVPPPRAQVTLKGTRLRWLSGRGSLSPCDGLRFHTRHIRVRTPMLVSR
ncbi:hypothetical protein DTO013E5_568 [Penicillium roqueforti]|nr:hypothetical protein CBS147337_877 [Penicillium roqueforti]KAI2745970.1 hypothetical protein DTO013F2_7142 [Penicillium roqueforti]KAI2746823.1 hypothetical protein DTO012A1_1654 [Penicillium roqueforti]KAI2764294.1 hypothetical protein DTO006G1_712 [Penicillium roqueforti]KAI2766427.1 hypothetical protein DTO012A8_8342 [Penicillium roqueforti]